MNGKYHLPYDLELISLESISYLIENHQIEDSYLDYKGGKIPKDITDIICSFLNSMGGHIVFGVEEDGNIPTRLIGISREDVSLLNDLIATNIRPRIDIVENSKVLQLLDDSKFILILFLPRMANKYFHSKGRFYVRIGDSSRYLESESEVEEWKKNHATTPLKLQSQIEILKSEHPMFHFISEGKNLQTVLNLPQNIEEVIIDHFLLPDILNVITSENDFNILIKGESGVGKTALLFQVGKMLLKDKHFILAIPFFGANPLDMVKVLETNKKVVFILNDLDLFEKRGNFLDSFRNYHIRVKNIITTCRLHEYYNLASKYEFLEEYFTYSYLIAKGKNNFLMNILDKYLEHYSIEIQDPQVLAIKDLLIKKSEGLVLYIVEVINNFAEERKEKDDFFTLEYVEQLPEGIIAYICNLYYRTFIDVDENVRDNRLFELKILFLLATLIGYEYHHVFIESLVTELLTKTSSESNLTLNVHPQDYLVKIDSFHYSFSHSIWKIVLINGKKIIEPLKSKYSESMKRILDVVENTIELISSEFSDPWTAQLPALERSIASFSLDSLPVELWINILVNFAFFYQTTILPFFLQFIKDRTKHTLIIEGFLGERKDLYLKWLEYIRLYGRSNRDAGNFESAINSFNIGLIFSELVNIGSVEVDFTIALAMTYRYLMNYEKTLEYQKKALTVSQKLNHKELIAHSSYNLAITHFELEQFQECEELLEDIEEIYRYLNDKSGIANLFVLKGLIARTHGKLTKERTLMKQALKLAEESKKPLTKINTLSNLATTYMVDPGDFPQAKVFLEEAKDLALKYIEPRELMKITINLSTVYINLGDNKKAKENLETGLKFARSLKDEETEAVILSQLGSLFFRERDDKTALQYADESRKLCEKHNLKKELVLIYRLLGRIYLKNNKLKETLSEFNKSHTLIKPYLSDDSSDDTFIWLNQYSDLLASTNKVNEALKLYKDADRQWKRLPESYKSSDVLNIMYFRIKLNQYSFELKKAIDIGNTESVTEIGGCYASLIQTLNELPKEIKLTSGILNILIKSMINYANSQSVLFQMTGKTDHIKKAIKLSNETIALLNKFGNKIPDSEDQIDECFRIQKILFDLGLNS